MGRNTKKSAVIVISSHVARGSVGNRAAVFTLEAFGFPVWAIPTVILPWHPGHGPSTRLEHDAVKFDSFVSDIAQAPWIDEVGAVLTGYMANEAQVRSVAKLVTELKQRNPSIVYLCDPVIGDNGGLYIHEETAFAVRECFLPLCDIVTPNRFELAWLALKDEPRSHQEVCSIAEALGPETVLSTSSPGFKPQVTGNVLSIASKSWGAFHSEIPDPPNGPGDLTAAVFLAHRLSGDCPQTSLFKTTASVFEILNHATRRNSDELTLESDVASLLNPKIEIPVIMLQGENA